MSKFSFIFVCLSILILASCNTHTQDCTDPHANNFNSSASENDGSCTYNEVWLKPVKSIILPESLKETSGLLFWKGRLWTHNDDTDTHIYGLDTSSAAILEEYLLEGVENINWEDMDQDSEYIYLGDFGNNASGNREDLHILRIQKSSLLSAKPLIDTIWFSYSDQIDLSPVGFNQTEFDCEALVVGSEYIYLFTKQWVSGYTTAYILSKQAGTHVAQKLDSFDISGLVTGAFYMESKHLLVLCAYTGVLQPFLYLLYDFQGDDFFGLNKRRVNLSIPFHQVEGISSLDGLTYYISNESYVKEPVNIPQKLHLIELHPYLEDYLNGAL